MTEQYLRSDVLIIGGGVAGLNAALSAAHYGLDIIIMDKAVIERSGHIAGGVDHFMAYLDTGPEWDTAQAYLEYTQKTARGATDLSAVESIYCNNLKEAIKRFSDLGVPLTQQNGKYFRTQSYGQPGPLYINFDGRELKPKLAKAVRNAGCSVLDRVMAVELLLYDGQVCGAVGFNIRDGTYYVIQAHTVVVSAGGTNRLYQNPTGLSFNTWMCPANTGDAEALSYMAGANLANVEYLRMTVVPKGFSAAGLNALVGMGAKLVNGKGEDFMTNYDPLGMKAPRSKLVQGVLGELKAHRGPVYVDCRHLDREALNHLLNTLSYDKNTLPDYFEQLGIDLSEDLMEVATSEGMLGGPSEVCGSGIHIGARCETNLPGLYAAGNSADQCRGLHMAFTSGINAGTQAALTAKERVVQKLPLPKRQIKEIKERIFGPLLFDDKKETHWQELEDVLQRIVTEGLGPVRSGWGIKASLNRLDDLEKWRGRVRVNNYHELMRLNEVFDLMTVVRCMFKAAETREESRFGLCHYRMDFPKSNDKEWLGQLIINLGKQRQPEAAFRPLRYD
jgi:adenylylsulfate reductase subunit A